VAAADLSPVLEQLLPFRRAECIQEVKHLSLAGGLEGSDYFFSFHGK
jgi:hypothetical protein